MSTIIKIITKEFFYKDSYHATNPITIQELNPTVKTKCVNRSVLQLMDLINVAVGKIKIIHYW